MRKQNNFRFNPKDKERWQKCAKKQTGNNLTTWMETVLNKAAGEILDDKGKVKKVV